MPTAKKLPSGSWRCQAFSHSEIYFDESGNKKTRRIYESFTASTKKEAEFMAAEFKLDSKRTKQTSDLTLFEAIDKYVEDRNNILSPSTIQGYKTIKKASFAGIMYVPLKKIDRNMLQEAVNVEANRKSKGKRTSGTISAKTVKNSYGLIRAVINQYEPNINTNVTLPAVQKVIKELLPPEIIYDAFKNTEIELPVLMSMWLSFSMSELRGIKKSDITNGYITIKRTVVDIEGKPLEKNSTKAYDRTRRLKLPAYLLLLVEQCRTEYICPYTSRALYAKFSKRLKKLQLPHMAFHDLRHVNASVMHKLNVPDKYAMERGGWSTDHIMKAVYTHTFSDERQHIDDVINSYFDGIVQHEIQHESSQSL